jgi:DNA-binding NtrC family response regulator
MPTSGMKILIADANEVVRRQLFLSLRKGHVVYEAAGREEALTLLPQVVPDVVLLDPFDGNEGEERGALAALRRLMEHPGAPPVLILTRSERKDLAARMLRMGALDVLRKPVDAAELDVLLRRVVRLRDLGVSAAEGAAEAGPGQLVADGDGIAVRMPRTQTDLELGIIGVDRRIAHLVEQVRRIAPTPVSVLITGETGTGKEIFAQAIHKLSDRRTQRFVALNCAVLSDNLVEDELFGHEKGAFTGAVERRKGKIEYANQGTLFLDEIGDLSPGLQAKFLRVLQERTFERLGGNQPISVDIRLISATHRDLPRMAKEGAFREDLMFRVNVVTLHIPPLRERRGDIRLLAQHFLKEYGRSFGRGEDLVFAREVERFLLDYPWPGNVRELRHFVERAVALSDGNQIGLEALPETLALGGGGVSLAEGRAGFNSLVRQYKRQLVMEALKAAGNDKNHTASLLGISRSYLFKLIRQLNIPGARQRRNLRAIAGGRNSQASAD